MFIGMAYVYVVLCFSCGFIIVLGFGFVGLVLVFGFLIVYLFVGFDFVCLLVI